MWLVVLVWHQSNMPKVEEPFQLCEFFSGDARVSKSCKEAMISTASLDIKQGENLSAFRQNPFDMTLPSGFAILGWQYILIFTFCMFCA